ncbi:AraC family ligand binding domain-containing protein [Roseococcus suduntuyensis]|uniref:AraC family ligand binding domain-containing protein n=1 Tax=Roseococcus suduntuyensis TaxID=455361 RepID=UPI0035D465CC
MSAGLRKGQVAELVQHHEIHSAQILRHAACAARSPLAHLRRRAASSSGRGPVEAGPGDVITVNPGEVHDGAPIGE